MTYVCTTWEFSADTHLTELQRLKNDIFRTNFQDAYGAAICPKFSKFRKLMISSQNYARSHQNHEKESF
jgi:hypothetical protein